VGPTWTPTNTPTPTSTPTNTPTRTPTATPSGAPTTLLGDQNIEGNQDDNPAGKAEAFQYTATAGGTLNKLYIYIDGNNTATQVVVGLYDNNASNNPGNLLAQATIVSPAKGAWNLVSVPAASITAGAKYWIAVLGPLGSGIVKFRDVGLGGKAQVSSQSNLTVLPAIWSPGTTYSNSPLSAYGTN